ncbi:MAG: carboxypeptidase M32 [Candidatus Thermoplasmatota archaeon]|nr:carboxypeptidase M32 [Candidatus Thermoplasmatota archaeon]
MSTYEDLLEISEQLQNIQRSLSLLVWDERTYMPKGAVEGRSESKAELSQLYHEKLTSEKTKRCIDELNKESAQAELDEVQKAAVREMTRDFERKYKVPDELIKKMSKASTKAQSAWEEARERSDFEHFLPHLEKQIELKKEAAEYIGYENETYDAFIDEYEPGFTAEKVKKIFDPMKKELSSIVSKILSKDLEPGKGVFEGKTFPVKEQKKLCRELTEDLGFDFEHGRLDKAVHPFTIGMDDDVRLTNRYSEENITSIFSLMHETGHALYEQGLPSEWYGQHLGGYISMGYHESQSRMWENFVGRSREFLDHIFPKLCENFSGLKKHSKDEFYRRINRVKPTFIRVEADEVTYNLHIALRYDIELGLFRDELEPEETKVVWENKMDEYLDIVPEDPAQGVLQDVHWSAGQFGYFPTYALGNLYAAQIFDTAREEIDGLKDDISQGRFESLRGWLRENIHQHGRKYKAKKMTERLTGEELTAEYHLDHLEDKYGSIYGL